MYVCMYARVCVCVRVCAYVCSDDGGGGGGGAGGGSPGAGEDDAGAAGSERSRGKLRTVIDSIRSVVGKLRTVRWGN